MKESFSLKNLADIWGVQISAEQNVYWETHRHLHSRVFHTEVWMLVKKISKNTYLLNIIRWTTQMFAIMGVLEKKYYLEHLEWKALNKT